MRKSTPPKGEELRAGPAQGLGLLLFLFIPLVLFLFVRRPEPVGVSLVVGIVLMIGHRFLARPFMDWARRRKCLWSNRGVSTPTVPVVLETRGGVVETVCLARHRDDVMRFFAFVHRWRWPVRLGIFVPLLALLGTSVAAALGRTVPIATVTGFFQLGVGLTVNVVAWGYRFSSPGEVARVPFPVHNFFLLGIRNLLWVFRVVGVWWIVVGLRALT